MPNGANVIASIIEAAAKQAPNISEAYQRAILERYRQAQEAQLRYALAAMQEQLRRDLAAQQRDIAAQQAQLRRDLAAQQRDIAAQQAQFQREARLNELVAKLATMTSPTGEPLPKEQTSVLFEAFPELIERFPGGVIPTIPTGVPRRQAEAIVSAIKTLAPEIGNKLALPEGEFIHPDVFRQYDEILKGALSARRIDVSEDAKEAAERLRLARDIPSLVRQFMNDVTSYETSQMQQALRAMELTGEAVTRESIARVRDEIAAKSAARKNLMAQALAPYLKQLVKEQNYPVQALPPELRAFVAPPEESPKPRPQTRKLTESEMLMLNRFRQLIRAGQIKTKNEALATLQVSGIDPKTPGFAEELEELP